jgi:hypothetical protein
MENTTESPSAPVTSAPRFRVIEGTLYARATVPSAYRTNIHELGHGYVEAVTYPHYSWHEVDNLCPQALTDLAMAEGNIWVNGAWEKSELSAVDRLDKLARNR